LSWLLLLLLLLLLRVALVGTLKAGTTTTFTVHGLTMLDSSTVYVLREGFRLGRRSTDIAVIDADNFTYDTTRLVHTHHCHHHFGDVLGKSSHCVRCVINLSSNTNGQET